MLNIYKLQGGIESLELDSMIFSKHFIADG